MEKACEKRVKALLRYQILDSPTERSFDEIAQLASELSGSRFAAISFLDGERQWFKSIIGLDSRESLVSESICAQTIAQRIPLILPDVLNDERFSTKFLGTSGPHLRFYAGFPLLSCDRTPIGTLCVFDDRPRAKGLSASEISTLKLLASQVEAQLELRLAILESDAQVERLSALTRDLQHCADHDALTALPNRAHFAKTLEAAMQTSLTSESSLALMLIDVDHFKQINDSLGHDAGDELLRSFAAKLRSVVRGSDTVARIGGDEFAVLLAGDGVAEQFIDDVVGSLYKRLSKTIRHRGRSIEIQASIGVALFPKDASSAEGLVKCADLALSEAKNTRNMAIRFAPHLKDNFEQLHRTAAGVRAALAAGDLSPFYQPKIDLHSGRVVGFEALMRQCSGGRVLTVPHVFDLEFPDGKLTAEVGQELISQILDDMKSWVLADIPFGHVAINSCGADFSGDNFAEHLLSEIAKRRLSPGLVELEVTEGVFLGRGAAHVARALNLLSDAGVRIALDDFGTGYASLSHLKQFPVHVLKIDRSFVAGIGRNADDEAIVRAVIGLGLNLGMETVAEGIETSEQEAFVRLHGCNVGQGFLYGAAVSSPNILADTSLQFAKLAA